MTEAVKPLVGYVAGWGRSGSTLVERVLHGTPGAIGVGELDGLWARQRDDVPCGCGASVSACAFWGDVLGRAFGSELDAVVEEVRASRAAVCRVRQMPSLLTGAVSAAVRSDVESYGSRMAALYGAIADTGGARVVVDTSKSPVNLAALARSGQVRLMTIHLVRDPVAVAHSWTRDMQRRTPSGTQRLRTYSPIRSAVEWSYRNALAELAGRLTDCYERVAYEDLTADPERAFGTLAVSLGLDADAVPISRTGELSLAAGHGILGNPMRERSGTVEITPDGRWRTEMPRARRRLVRLVSGPARLRYR